MSLNIPCLVPGKQSKHIQIGQFPFHNVGSSRRFHRFGMALYSTRFYFTGICTNSLFAFRPILSNMSSLLATGNLMNYSKIRDRAKVMQFLSWLYFEIYGILIPKFVFKMNNRTDPVVRHILPKTHSAKFAAFSVFTKSVFPLSTPFWYLPGNRGMSFVFIPQSQYVMYNIILTLTPFIWHNSKNDIFFL